VRKLGVPLTASWLLFSGCAQEEPKPECPDLTGAATAEIVMLDNTFEPDCFTVSRDQGLTIRNRGTALHNFSVQDSTINLDVAAGNETSVEEIGEVLQRGTPTSSARTIPRWSPR
jgi:hypothetical protein